MRPYHPYTPDQAYLLPLSLAEAVSPDDPVHVVRQVVHGLDLRRIHEAYRCERGRPPFHPRAMVGLLLYGACRGIYSSRRLAQACRDHVTLMYLTGRLEPDFHTIARFRQRFREELRDLFRQVLQLCRAAGLVRLGHVSLDGTKARERAEREGRHPEEAVVSERAQSNFTDPDSRIMHTPDGFQQCYNAQVAVDAESQVIVAQEVSRSPPDVQRLRPMLERITALNGVPPKELSADAGHLA